MSHSLVSLAVLTSIVAGESSGKESVGDGAGPGAVDDVVSLVNGAVGSSIEKTRGELSGGVIGQMFSVHDLFKVMNFVVNVMAKLGVLQGLNDMM